MTSGNIINNAFFFSENLFSVATENYKHTIILVRSISISHKSGFWH